MKKTLIIMIAIVLMFTVIGCTKDQDMSQQSVATVEKGILKVGMDLQYPPFETFDSNNDPIGISVDVAQGLADYLELELEVYNMDFSTLIPALETNEIDIVIASMSITEERERKVDFTNPYFFFKIIGLMNADYAVDNELTIDSSADDLWGVETTKFIGLAGQISVTIPEEYGFVVEQSVDKAAAITEITTGKSDVFIMSPEVVIGAHEAFEETTEVFWSALSVSPIGMAVVDGNSDLLAKANQYIAGMDEDGGIYDGLRTKYDDDIKGLFGSDATMDFYIYDN